MRIKTLWDSLSIEEKNKRNNISEHIVSKFGLETFEGRWFDYRVMSDAECIHYFAEIYREIYKEYYIRTVDIQTVDSITPFSPADIYQSRDCADIYKARNAADAIGCKYEFYIRRAFDLFLFYGHRTMPRPKQLHSEEMFLDITRMWEERCSQVLQLAEHEFYTADRWVGHPDQVAYYDWLIAHINKRGQKAMVLSDLLRKSILPKEVVLAEFGQDVFNRTLFY